MKTKDRFYLAKLDLKTDKSYKGVSISLIVAQIILVLFLFLNLSVGVSVNNHLNTYEELKTFDVELSRKQLETNYTSAINVKYLSSIKKTKGLSNMICYNIYFSKSYNTCYIDDVDFHIGSLSFTMLDMKNTSDVFTIEDYKYSESPLICGNTFSSDSKHEMMISSELVKRLNITNQDCIGKSLTIKSNYSDFSADVSSSLIELNDDFLEDYNYKSFNLLNDFTIVGVYDSNIYDDDNESRDKANSTNYFWVTTDSLPTEESIVYPSYEICATPKGDSRYCYYYNKTPNELEENAINGGYIYLPLGLGVSMTNSRNIFHPQDMSCYLKYDTLDRAYNAYTALCQFMKQSNSISDYIPRGYELNFNMSDVAKYYPIYYTVVAMLVTFGLIIFIMNFANMLNTFYHEIIEKKHYYGLLRATGIQNKDIRIIYASKALLIYLKSFIISTVISLTLAIIIKLYIQSELKLDIVGYNLNINIGFYFLSLLMINLCLLTLYIVLIICLSHKLYKEKIIDVVNSK